MSKLSELVARLPPAYRPTLAALGAAEEAIAMMSKSHRFAANLSRQAQRLSIGRIGAARAVALGDIGSDVSGDVNAIQNFDTSSAGSTVTSLVNVGLQAYKTGQDVSKATGGGGASSSSSGGTPGAGMTPAQWLAFIQNYTDSAGKYNGPPLRYRGRTYQPPQVPALAKELANVTRAGQSATAYYSVNKGPWTAVQGKWGPDGSHFVPNTPLPAGAVLRITSTGAPPTVDPSGVSLRTRKTASGATVATSQSTTASVLPVAALAAGALFLAQGL